jgi:solute carrier family 25 carnitine/acylcarnitine transporter 20/29
LFRNVLAGASYFMVFETARLHRAAHHNCTVKQLPVVETFVCGGLAGLAYWLPFYPIDVVKGTLQADSYLRDQRKYSGFMDAAKQVYARSGVKGFYRGFTPCILRSFPANAAMLVTVFQLQNLGFPW